MAGGDVIFTTIGNAKRFLEEEVLAPGAPDEMECSVDQVHIWASIACSLKKIAEASAVVTPKLNIELKGMARMDEFFRETTFVAPSEGEG